MTNLHLVYTGTGAVSSTLSAVELDMAIICACMPAFRQFLGWLAPGIIGSAIKKGKYYGPEGGFVGPKGRGING